MNQIIRSRLEIANGEFPSFNINSSGVMVSLTLSTKTAERKRDYGSESKNVDAAVTPRLGC